MENVTNKALIIGIGIFITVAITSGIFYTITEMRNIYSKVYETDISISKQFSEFEAYNGGEQTGLEVANTFNKYNNRSNVIVEFYNNNPGFPVSGNLGTWLVDKENRLNDGFYSTIYTSSISINNDIVTIIFKIK